MTLVVCPNLAIDRVLSAHTFCPGELTRCHTLSQQAGGKGANVIRALQALRDDGSAPHDELVGFAGGMTGRLLADLIASEELPATLVPCGGETRISTVLLADDGDTSCLFEYGPFIGQSDEEALFTAVKSRPAQKGEWAIVDGAVPPGARPDFYATICHALTVAGYSVLVDAAGLQLVTSLATRPDMVKINFAEAWSAMNATHEAGSGPGRFSHPELVDVAIDLCERLREAGARDAIITLGRHGAVATCGAKTFSLIAPGVATSNAVGSGDCFAAALALGLERGDPVEGILSAASGVAAANAATPLTGRFDVALARRLTTYASIEVLADQPPCDRQAHPPTLGS